jgi:ribonucleoside-diphosphate reductase alpha chain
MDGEEAAARQTELFSGEGTQAERLAGVVPIGLQSPQSIEAREKWVFQAQSDAPACYECGSLMVRSGSCYRCNNCGSTSGCS